MLVKREIVCIMLMGDSTVFNLLSIIVLIYARIYLLWHFSPEEYLTLMFDICRTEDGKASISMLLEVGQLKSGRTFFIRIILISLKLSIQEIQKTGIRTTDPRLENMMRMLENLKPYALPSIEDLKLDVQTFKSVLCENVVLVTKALQNQMIIPAFEAFTDNITSIYEQVKRARQ